MTPISKPESDVVNHLWRMVRFLMKRYLVHRATNELHPVCEQGVSEANLSRDP
jgi:hypothetical protein